MNLTSQGKEYPFGVMEPLPLRGFPAGKSRIRMRNTSFVYVFIRPPEGGIRKFIVVEEEGNWAPAWEVEANRKVEA